VVHVIIQLLGGLRELLETRRWEVASRSVPLHSSPGRQSKTPSKKKKKKKRRKKEKKKERKKKKRN